MSKAFFETFIKAQMKDDHMAIDSTNNARAFYEGYLEWLLANAELKSRCDAEEGEHD